MRFWRTAGIRICCALVLGLPSCAGAQTPSRPVEPPTMQQLHQAMKAADRGDPAQALALTGALLEEHPDFVPALKFEGLLLEQTGHDADAAVAYQKALKLAPNDADLLFNVGVHDLVAGDKAGAIELLSHHVKLIPKDGDAYFYLAQAYHLSGDDEHALRSIEQAARLEPANAAVLQKYGELLTSSRDSAAALSWLQKAQQADASLPGLDYDIALAEYKSMDLNNAAQHASHAVDLHPNDVNALQLLASIELKLSHWQEAQSALERVLIFKKDDTESLLGLGHCEVELKNYQAAVDTLNRLLQLDPMQLPAHFYLSRAYVGLGNTAEAEHQAALHHLMMEQMSFVRSTESEQRENAIKAQARELLEGHREAEALALYRQHFKGTPATAADAYVFVGKLYLFLGRDEDGLRCLHRALEIQPAVRGAHTYEGILDLKLGDLNKAQSEFQAELANDPNYQTAIAEMGEVRYHQQRWAEAAEQLARSRTMTPELLYMLCDAYFHLGKAQDADLTAETVAAYGRGNPALMQGLIDLLNKNSQPELAQRLSADLKP